LAEDHLRKVRAATLLIVGGNDGPVIGLNEFAFSQLSVEKRLEIVPGASHLFEERGALDAVAELASDWFTRHLGPSITPRREVGS
jgi:pimeloyl-ACP methyl ester carboxylesterase